MQVAAIAKSLAICKLMGRSPARVAVKRENLTLLVALREFEGRAANGVQADTIDTIYRASEEHAWLIARRSEFSHFLGIHKN